MKKIFVLIWLVMLLSIGFADAKSEKSIVPPIKFCGTKFNLLYSAKSTETGGYLNEYYRANQTYSSWTELIGVHHYPTSFYPIEHARDFASYLESTGVVVNIEVDDKNNTALLYFVITSEQKLPIVMEFNIFKYQKSPVCGAIGLQYAKRYLLNNPLEVRKAKKELIKSGVKYIGKFNKLKVPDVVTFDVENGKVINAEEKEAEAKSENNVKPAEEKKAEFAEQTKTESGETNKEPESAEQTELESEATSKEPAKADNSTSDVVNETESVEAKSDVTDAVNNAEPAKADNTTSDVVNETESVEAKSDVTDAVNNAASEEAKNTTSDNLN